MGGLNAWNDHTERENIGDGIGGGGVLLEPNIEPPTSADVVSSMTSRYNLLQRVNPSSFCSDPQDAPGYKPGKKRKRTNEAAAIQTHCNVQPPRTLRVPVGRFLSFKRMEPNLRKLINIKITLVKR